MTLDDDTGVAERVANGLLQELAMKVIVTFVFPVSYQCGPQNPYIDIKK